MQPVQVQNPLSCTARAAEAVACRILVLISGSGTNLQALIDAFQSQTETAQIVAVISNRPQAFGLERARQAGIPARALDHHAYPDREHFDQALMAEIDSFQPDLVLLAGFMRILTPAFVEHYSGRLLNIHPSLLPKYKGLHTHQRALDAGDSEHGTTVHFVTAELDGGPLVIQARIPVLPGDSAEDLAARVQLQEHQLFPLVVHWFARGRLQLQDNRACLDGQPITADGLRLENFQTDMREYSDAL